MQVDPGRVTIAKKTLMIDGKIVYVAKGTHGLERPFRGLLSAKHYYTASGMTREKKIRERRIQKNMYTLTRPTGEKLLFTECKGMRMSMSMSMNKNNTLQIFNNPARKKWVRILSALALMFVTAFFAVQVMDVRRAISPPIVELMAETPMRLLAYIAVYCVSMYSITLGVVLGMLVFVIDVNIQYGIYISNSKSNTQSQ